MAMALSPRLKPQWFCASPVAHLNHKNIGSLTISSWERIRFYVQLEVFRGGHTHLCIGLGDNM